MAQQPVDIEAVKDANPIEGVIEETEPLTRHGRYWRGTKHDSLVVDVKKQAYFWNSKGTDEQGDVITWLVTRGRCQDFKDAVEFLSRRSGLPLPDWKSGDAQARIVAREREDALTVAGRWFVRQLRASPDAQAYAGTRGWSAETIQDAGLGYSGAGQKADLRAELSMWGVDVKSTVVQAIMKIPDGMLIYPHVRSGRVRYLSARSITEKRHYNLDAELAGDRQPYFNHEWSWNSEDCVVVEGQADAVTLGQWGFAAVALNGTSSDDALHHVLRDHKRTYVGLDSDGAGQANALKLASTFGPLTRIVQWGRKDANDWLREDKVGTADVQAVLETATTYVERVCADAGAASASQRGQAVKGAFLVVALLEDGDLALYRKTLCKLLKVDQREFNNLLKVAKKEIGKDLGEENYTAPVEILGGFMGDHLLELVYDAAANETKLAVRFPGGEWAEMHQVNIQGTVYQGQWPSAMMTKGVVLFPSRIGDLLPAVELRKRIQTFIRKYLDVPQTYERLASYYVMFTWLYDCFRTLPYLRALGDSGTGKSRFLDVIGRICYRPTITMGATTTSPIFRLLDRYRGTLILDEADFSQSDTTADIIKIINVGFTAGTPVLRSGSDRENFEPEAFSVYGPKILSTRKMFQDDATEKRCLTHKTGNPTTRSDIPLHLEANFHAEALELRNLLLTYRLKNWQPEILVDEKMIDRVAVEPRLNQVILGLITMVDDPDLRDDIKKLVKDYNAELIGERSMTLTAQVLRALVEAQCGGAGGTGIDGEPYWDLTVKRLTMLVNRLIDDENESDDEPPNAEDQKKFKMHRDVGNKRIASICRTDLQLTVKRTTWGTKSMGVEWDEGKIRAHCARFGVDWQQPTYVPNIPTNGHTPPPPPAFEQEAF